MPKLKSETLEARRHQILQAALVCFARSGYHQTSVDDISQEAGLSKGSIYTYFESKKALFLALLDQLVQDTGLPGILTTETTTEQEKFNASLESMIRYADSGTFRNYAALLMVAWREAQSDPVIGQIVAGLYAGLRDDFTRVIQQGIASGQIPPVEASAFASILIAIFDGLMVQAMVDEQAVDWQAVSQAIRDMWMADADRSN